MKDDPALLREGDLERVICAAYAEDNGEGFCAWLRQVRPDLEREVIMWENNVVRGL
jgi:hypothetical protein